MSTTILPSRPERTECVLTCCAPIPIPAACGRLFERKALLVNVELDAMGLGRYQKCIWLLCGMGYLLDLLWANAFGLSEWFCTVRSRAFGAMGC